MVEVLSLKNRAMRVRAEPQPFTRIDMNIDAGTERHTRLRVAG